MVISIATMMIAKLNKEIIIVLCYSISANSTMAANIFITTVLVLYL